MRSKCIITFSGLNLRHLLDALCRLNITVWGVQRRGMTCTIAVSARQAEQTIALLREKCYNIENTRYTGLSGALRFVKKHSVLPLLMVLCVALLAISSQFCLKIVVSGDYAADDVLNVLADAKISVGSNISRLNVDSLENSIAGKLDAMYAVVKRSGSVLYVNVVQKKQIDPPIDMNKRRDIVATRDGTVTSVVCEQGTAEVSVGDRVKKGDVLIKGERTYSDGTCDQVYALGNVELQITASGFARFDGYKRQVSETGRVFECTGVVLWGKEYAAECPFDSYTLQTQSRYLYPLHLEIRRNVYRETCITAVPASLQECLLQLQTAAYQQALSYCDFAVISVRYDNGADGVTATLYGAVHIT